MSNEKRGRGRPKRAKPSATVCFKIDLDKKESLMDKYGGHLNKMFDEWANKLLQQ